MNALYHYTDLDAFVSIVQNKKLRLTGAHNLNDHQEINWTISKVQRRLSDLAKIHGNGRADKIWALLHAGAGVPHICALSSESDLLSQWRAYSKDGTGVSLGFKRGALPTSGQLPVMTFAAQHSLSLHQVIYDQQVQDAIISQILAPVFESAETDDNADLAMSTAVSALNGLSTIFKNEAFHEEKEWRIVHRPIIVGKPGTADVKIMQSASAPKHRVAGRRLVTYFEYDFSTSAATDVFAELVLGPKCEASWYDLSILLSQNGLEHLPIRQSSASYR